MDNNLLSNQKLSKANDIIPNEVENRMRIIANLIIDKYLDDKKNGLLKTYNENSIIKT